MNSSEIQKIRFYTHEYFKKIYDTIDFTFLPKEVGAHLGLIVIVDGIKYYVKTHSYGNVFPQFSKGWTPKNVVPFELVMYRAFQSIGMLSEVHIFAGRNPIDTYIATREIPDLTLLTSEHSEQIMLLHIIQQTCCLTDLITNPENYFISDGRLVIVDFRPEFPIRTCDSQNIINASRPFYKYGRNLPQHIQKIVYLMSSEERLHLIRKNKEIITSLKTFVESYQTFVGKNVVLQNLENVLQIIS